MSVFIVYTGYHNTIIRSPYGQRNKQKYSLCKINGDLKSTIEIDHKCKITLGGAACIIMRVGKMCSLSPGPSRDFQT